MRTRRSWFLAAILVLGCAPTPNEAPAPVDGPARTLAGLTADELRRFQDGHREYTEVDDVAEGLGPLFNGSSCAHCHNQPNTGGGGLLSVVRAGCRDGAGAFHEPPGGTLVFLFSTRPDIARATIPTDCKLIERRRTTTTLGLGLIEAIPDEQIVAQASAPRPDGVAGHLSWVDEEGRHRVGRFGWKAQHASLRVFAGDAYRNEMGVTNELFPTENAPGGDQAMLAQMDWTHDPEARRGALDALADFMRFTAPPGTGVVDAEGDRLFADVGCAACHRPSYTTSPGPSAAISGREVRLYSDLLLHDVGTGSLIPQGGALAGELRTPPLWGLGSTPLLLHDGRTASIDEAIVAHGGEAMAARDRYQSLSAADRARLLEFLKNL